MNLTRLTFIKRLKPRRYIECVEFPIPPDFSPDGTQIGPLALSSDEIENKALAVITRYSPELSALRPSDCGGTISYVFDARFNRAISHQVWYPKILTEHIRDVLGTSIRGYTFFVLAIASQYLSYQVN